MTDYPKQPQLPPAIQAVLAALRRRIRRHVYVQGLAGAVACLGVAFWASLAVDWFFEPPPAIRGLILAITGLMLAGVLFRLIVRRAFVPLRDRNMAMLLERYFPQFDESLLTAVELLDGQPGTAQCNPDMLARTCRLAAEPIGGVRLQRIFNPAPLRRSVAAAVLLAMTVGLFGMQFPEALGVWARRSLLFSNTLWPRKTRLVVEGFPDGVTKVARGADLTLLAKADLSMPLVPNVVHIRYRTQRGSRLRATMTRDGTVDPAKDQFQEYSYTFSGVLTPIRFDVIGGDDAVRDLRIEVVDSPTIVQMVLDCRFPAYMDRPPRNLPATGVMQIPMGTAVTIRGTANKDLVHVSVESALEDAPRPRVLVQPGHLDGPRGQVVGTRRVPFTQRPDRRKFQYSLGTLTEDTALLFTLLDTDGIKSRQPLRLTLVALADQQPEVAVQLRGIGSAITAQARLPAAGHITDDYGVARIWFEYTVDQRQPQAVPIESPSGNPTDFRLEHALDARHLELNAGQKLLLSVKAADRYDLAEHPNVGTSERWLLDVVTAEQLRTMLESRELVLRQRFETIIAEVSEIRDSLVRMEFDSPTADSADGAPVPRTSSDDKQPPTDDGGRPFSSTSVYTTDEKGDPREDEEKAPSRRLLSLRTLCVQRAFQNSQKDAREILGVAEAFTGIREELINNRIDTEELKLRLEQGIANPLRRIVDQMLPELDRRLDILQATLADGQAGPQNRNRATAHLDGILFAMREVLARMIELEGFNEAVELLRQIIESQKQLGSQTEQRHKQKLRELLED